MKRECEADGAFTATRAARREFLRGAILVLSCALLISLYMPFLNTAHQLLDRGSIFRSDRTIISAFLLNVALLAFSWRRYRDLHRLEQGSIEPAPTEHPGLTGLPGMDAFADATEARIRHEALNSDAEIVLLSLDVDHYDLISDIHGNDTADRLLRAVADALAGMAPGDTLLTHRGGGKFVMAFTVASPDLPGLRAMVHDLSQSMDWTFTIDDRKVHASCSMGAASTLGETVDYAELMRRSQMAMRFAMRRGHGQCVWFGSDMDIELKSRSTVEDAIRAGIPRNEFKPFFEQQIDLATGDIVGFEVLARWSHPVFGTVPTERFIEVAEKTNLISGLSLSIMRQAFEEAIGWDAAISLSVNVSPVQMRDPWLADKLLRLLTETGFPASRLELEITETALMEDVDQARAMLASLKKQGVGLALDDFGTGYSSLQYLRSLPFDRIKIDKSFIQSMDHNTQSGAITASIISLADNLGLPVTAEGVETPEVLQRLQKLGCEKAQGWLFGRPLPAEEARKIARPFPRLVSGMIHKARRA